MAYRHIQCQAVRLRGSNDRHASTVPAQVALRQGSKCLNGPSYPSRDARAGWARDVTDVERLEQAMKRCVGGKHAIGRQQVRHVLDGGTKEPSHDHQPQPGAAGSSWESRTSGPTPVHANDL